MVIDDGKHLDAGVERVETLYELQVQRHREEHAHQDQVLREEHLES